jgi:hypothetical protein
MNPHIGIEGWGAAKIPSSMGLAIPSLLKQVPMILTWRSMLMPMGVSAALRCFRRLLLRGGLALPAGD